MDTFLILLFICVGIVYWDSKRRNKNISKTWENAFKNQTAKPIVEIDETEMLKVINEALKNNEIELSEEDDIALAESIDEIMEVEKEVPDFSADDARGALKKLGYKKAEIKKAITIVLSQADGGLTSSDIVTKALQILN